MSKAFIYSSYSKYLETALFRVTINITTLYIAFIRLYNHTFHYKNHWKKNTYNKPILKFKCWFSKLAVHFKYDWILIYNYTSRARTNSFKCWCLDRTQVFLLLIFVSFLRPLHFASTELVITEFKITNLLQNIVIFK